MAVLEVHTKILILDNTKAAAGQLRSTLEAENYSVLTAHDADAAIRLVVETRPDLVVLRWPGSEREGSEMCRQIRMWFRGPILVLCSEQENEAIIAALDSGADDYLIYPFRPAGLLARVHVLMNRFSGERAERGTVPIGKLKIDLSRRRVVRGSKEIKLTRTEFEILTCLAQNLDCVVTSKMILERVWGPFHRQQYQALRVHIGHIRKKIEPDPSRPRYIITEPGVGYRMTVPNDPVLP